MQQNITLIRNCLNIFLTQGLKVSMDDVARELVMSKRTLYEIFESKEELVLQCVNLLFEEEWERGEHDLNKSANIIEELFPILNFDIFNRMKKLRDFFEGIKKYYPDVFEKIVASHLTEYSSRIGKIISKGIKQGFFRKDINVEIIKILFFELQSTNKHSKELFERFSVGEIFQNTLLCFVRGISTLKGIELIDDIQRRNYPYFGDKKLCMKKCKTKKNQ